MQKKSYLQFFSEIITDDITRLFYACKYFERDYTRQCCVTYFAQLTTPQPSASFCDSDISFCRE